MSELLGWAAALGYFGLLAYGCWLFADTVCNWFARRINHD